MALVHVNAPGTSHSRKRLAAALLVFVVFPGAAGAYYFVYNVGTVSLYITDDEIANFAHLNITFTHVELKSAGALTTTPWVRLDLERTTVDLVALHDNITARLGLGRVTAGGYAQIRVAVESAAGTLKSGGTTSVDVPSGELRTDASFAVRAQGEVNLVLRLLVVSTGSQYALRPVFGGAAHV
jgi:hypothetical protein